MRVTDGVRPSGTRKRQPRYLDGKQIAALLGKLGDDYRPVAAICASGRSACPRRWPSGGATLTSNGELVVSVQLDRSGKTVPLETGRALRPSTSCPPSPASYGHTGHGKPSAGFT